MPLEDYISDFLIFCYSYIGKSGERKKDFLHCPFELPANQHSWFGPPGLTVEKKAGFNFFPCGQISLCPCQTLRSNDIRMTFGLLIDLARSDLFRVKVMGFSGVRKWHKNVYKMGNFQARELIFCMKRYFLISSPLCYTHFLIFAKKCLADISLKSPKYQNR